jgi:hypothetical protein
MMEGLVLKKKEGRGLFCNRARERGWILKEIGRRAGG